MSIPPAVKTARRAINLIFLVCGIGISSWVPMVPFAKTRLMLNEADLGLILLFLGAGAIIAMPLAGFLIQKYGSKIVILVAGIMIALFLPLLLFSKTVIALGFCLFVFGAAIGTIDVAMNAQAVIIQDKYGQHIMSSFHGLFSVGGLLGSFGIGFLMDMGLDPVNAAIAISIAILLITLSQFRLLLPHSASPESNVSSFALPKGPLIILGLLCFISFLAEGAMLDWSAVFLKFERGFADSRTGLGFAAFSVAMSVMRLTGDKIIHKIGQNNVVLYGSIVASAGFFVAVAVPHGWVTLTGFVLVGIGAANIVPILFSRAGSFPGIPAGSGLPAVTTLGYAGQLAGPAMIGFIAHWSSLPTAFVFISLLLLVVAFGFKQEKVDH
ncbi:MFS transporter [Emticicia sp. CRIBPO]|uniref:MFS transporter n=1 Tax=Emticicia sp. CRIBPO TaxID=2683258 RepID=UPI001412CA41|nr:MFS transporter [Emticicia sp. CRIBPO]NBA88411.1 MFS transporter [Emticicia sp. CRIBPO]